MPQTLGTLLVNDALPPKYRIKPGQELNKKTLKDLMIRIAREEPELYPDVVLKVKKLGDLISTIESQSPGLDDLDPPQGTSILLNRLDSAVKKEPVYEKKIKLLAKGQSDLKDHAMTSTGAFAAHVKSGGRGNPVQLAKSITSPVAAGGGTKGINPLTIKHSFGQGLNLGEYFTTALEARQNAIDTFLQVQEPGAINKTLTSNLNNLLVTEDDCGTKNGQFLNVSDPHIMDRFTADNAKYYRRNELVDSDFLRRMLNKGVEVVKVRTPMTCSSRDGVCSYCYGLLENKQKSNIGTNIGVRSAQAMSEPLVQMALDSKHAAKLSTAVQGNLRGLEGFMQLTKVPKNFLNKAIVSKKEGTVEDVSAAPQGGYYVTVQGKKHYVEPGFKVFVKPGDNIEAGTILSEGIPNPSEIVQYRGLGAGRKHYVDSLEQVFLNSGINIDKRHLENLAKQTLNYVTAKQSNPAYDIYAGETINYNKVRDILREQGKEISINQAVGKFLADEYLHHTAGTLLTPSIVNELKSFGVNSVKVTEEDSNFVPIMRSAEVTPVMNPDLLAKMGFRYLKRSFLEGVQSGAKSDIHGTSPWPSIMHGKEFGDGPKGHY